MGPDGGPNAFGNALGDSLAAANSGIPGPVSAEERAKILGMFDGSGLAGSSPYALSADGGRLGFGKSRSATGLAPSDGARAEALSALYTPDLREINATSSSVARNILDLASGTGGATFYNTAQQGGHYYMVGLVGRALGIEDDRLGRIMAYSQYPDQVSALDAFTNGTRFAATKGQNYAPAQAGFETEKALHALNGLPLESNLNTYHKIIETYSDNDAIVGVALHGLVDSVFHSHQVDGQMVSYVAPFGHGAHGSEPDFVSEDQVKLAGGAVIQALQTVSGNQLTPNQYAGAMNYVNDVVKTARDQTTFEGETYGPTGMAIPTNERMELNFRTAAANLLGSTGNLNLLKPNDIQSPFFAQAITRDLTIDQTQAFLNSGGANVSREFASTFAERGMAAASTVVNAYARITTGQEPTFPFSPDQLMDTKTWSLRRYVAPSVPINNQGWSLNSVVPGYAPQAPRLVVPGSQL